MSDLPKDVRVFERLFGPIYYEMPEPWQNLHTVDGRHHYFGEAEVLRGENFLMRILASLLRLPPSSNVPVELIIEKQGDGETWSRLFGESHFKTYLFLKEEDKDIFAEDIFVRERFGPISFGIALTIDNNRVYWAIAKWWLFGLPLPKLFAPISNTIEYIDDQGRYAFDIDLSVIFFGRLIAYRGWLKTD